MNKLSLLAAGLLATHSVQAISLKECLRMARDNYPAVKQYRMIEQTRDFTLENAAKGWMPHVSASAGVYAFTDILKSNAQMKQTGIDMKNYMANASVTVRQNVYDGGQISANRNVASAQAEVQRQQLNVTVYAINERVQQIYFAILLLDEQIVQNELHQRDFLVSEKNIRSMMKGGVANQSDLDAILVEKLRLEQQKDALAASREAYVRMLGIFIGKDLKRDEKLEKPESPDTVSGKNYGTNRPEMLYFSSQNLLLDAQRKQFNARLRPTVSLFGMGLIHSKVSGMVDNGGIAGGLSLSWNVGALYTRKNDIRKLDVQRQMNDNERDVFLFNNRLQNEAENGQIASLRRQISHDDEIIRLRESIRTKGDRKVEMGTESVNELVIDINAVNLAKAQKAQHEIQLLMEMYKLKNINNE